VRVPQPAPEQPLPESDQVTPLFAGSFETEALKFWVWPAVRLADDGETFTAMAARTVIFADADLAVSATEVAVSVTTAGEGSEEGAV
jgi:hypothetical protein